MKVLIADSDPSVRFLLGEVIHAVGHESVAAVNDEDGLSLLDQERPDLVLSGIMEKGRDGLLLLEEMRRRNPETFVVVLIPAGADHLAGQALKYKASNYLTKPIRSESLISLLEKYAEIIRGRHIHKAFQRMVLDRHLTMRLENRVNNVSEACDFLLREVDGILPHETICGIHLGLYELIMNAIEHGNLEVSYEEKRYCLESTPGRFHDLIEKRLHDPMLARRKVLIEFHMTGSVCEWFIEDEGAGFDWEQVPDPLLPENIESVCGRGIFLARLQFDELTFLGNGNRVRALKSFSHERETQT